MLDVRVDLIKNRLYLTVSGLYRNNTQLSVSLLEKAVHKLAPGFTCITRVINGGDLDDGDIAEIQAIQKLLADHQMAHVVRIGDENGRQLLNTFGRKVPYRITEAASMEDAEEILDQWTKQHERAAEGIARK